MHKKPLVRLLDRLFRAQAFWSRQTHRVEQLLGGFALGALGPSERAELTAAIYDARGDYELEGLFEWEESWLCQDLPPPPAKILLGGAGSGREVEHLLSQGYRVLAFDPAPSFVRQAGKRLDHPGSLGFLVGGYEELAGTRGGQRTEFQVAVENEAPFDAVLLGWGSLTHIATAESRRNLLRRLKELCPEGPVLASFWMMGDDSQRLRSRVWKIGWRAGRWLNPADRSTRQDTAGDEFSVSSGFGHYFTLPELAELAATAGYDISRSPAGAYAGVFPHMTLRPRKPN